MSNEAGTEAIVVREPDAIVVREPNVSDATDATAHDLEAEVDGTEVDKINTGALATLVAIGLLAMLTITAAVTALVRRDLEVEESIKDADTSEVVIGLKASQRAMLNAPASYLDRGKGVVALPIEVAKGLVLGELQRDPKSATPPASAATAAPAPSQSSTSMGPNAGMGGNSAVTSTDKAPKSGPNKQEKPQSKPPPSTSAKPNGVPGPTPTAAPPYAEAPGPVKH